MLRPLPPSASKFWGDGDKYLIDIGDIKTLLCKEHKFDIYRDQRDLKCRICGFTGRFTPTTLQVDTNKGIIKIRGTNHKLVNIF